MQNVKMAGSSPSILQTGSLTARDVSEYRVDMDVLWDVQFNQIEAPRTEFRCQYVTDGCAIVYEEFYGASATVGGALRGDRICFAVPNAVSRHGSWKGWSLPEASLAYAHGGKTVDVLFPAATSNIMAIVPRNHFAQQLERLTGCDVDRMFPAAGMFVRLTPATLRRLKKRLLGVLRGRAAGRPENLQEEISDAIIEACRSQIGNTEPASPAAWHHFRRTIDQVRLRETPAHLAALARFLGVTLRSLETAFHRCAGISPASYLRRTRLNRAREDLIELGPSETTVTGVAVKHGFTEFGRFAGEYRRVFGELPSQTLNSRSRRTRAILPGLR